MIFMPTGNVTGSVTISAAIRSGSSAIVQPITLAISQTGTTPLAPSVVLPAAQAGELTTRTNDTQGIITKTSHGLSGTETLALFWTDPNDGTSKCANDCTITSHDANTFHFTVVAGDVLPVGPSGTTPGTLLTFAVAQTITDATIPGTCLLQMMISSQAQGWCNLRSSGGTGVGSVQLATGITTTTPYIYPTAAGQAKPFTATVVTIDCYNATLAASTMTIEALLT